MIQHLITNSIKNKNSSTCYRKDRGCNCTAVLFFHRSHLYTSEAFSPLFLHVIFFYNHDSSFPLRVLEFLYLFFGCFPLPPNFFCQEGLSSICFIPYYSSLFHRRTQTPWTCCAHGFEPSRSTDCPGLGIYLKQGEILLNGDCNSDIPHSISRVIVTGPSNIPGDNLGSLWGEWKLECYSWASCSASVTHLTSTFYTSAVKWECSGMEKKYGPNEKLQWVLMDFSLFTEKHSVKVLKSASTRDIIHPFFTERIHADT